jgi:hypothetical protein
MSVTSSGRSSISKDDQVAFGVIGLDRMRDVLQQHRLARPRRRHDQRTLAFADRGHQVDDPGRAILDRRILDFHLQALIGIERREVVEGDLVLGARRFLEVDLRDVGQREIALVLARGHDHALDGIAGSQLCWRIMSGET